MKNSDNLVVPMAPIYDNLHMPPMQCDPVDVVDLGVLDRTSITSVVDFMHKFAEDSSFTPPTMQVMYDSDKFKVSVDDDTDNYLEDDLDNYDTLQDLQNARAQNESN